MSATIRRRAAAAWLHGVLAVALVVAALLPPVACPAQGTAKTLHLPGPVINVAAQGDLIVGCLGLRGTAFMVVDGDSSPTLAAMREDLPTLGALFLEEGRLLLAGRDGRIYRVDASNPRAPRKLDVWDVEGIPMSMTYRRGILTVASGAAGVLVFEWSGDGCAPRLRGRYPFVDYSKEAHYGPGGRLYVADNRETGLQVLDVSTPTRPSRVSMTGFGDFVDNVAVVGDLAIVGTRRHGLKVMDVSSDQPRLFLSQPPSGESEARVQAVEAVSAGTFAVAYGEGGTRLMRLCFRGDSPSLKTLAVLPAPDSPATSVAVLDGGRLVVGSLDGGVTVWIPPKECSDPGEDARCMRVPTKPPPHGKE